MSETSFTQRVVDELAPHIPVLPCCRRALLDGMLLVSESAATISTTRLAAARAAMHTLHSDSVSAHVRRVALPARPRYELSVRLEALPSASANLCCTKSRWRGAFLCAGRLQRPDAGPHLEVSAHSADAVQALAADAAALGVAARVRPRRRRWLLTIRSAAAVGALLSSIDAHSGRLDFEAGRVVREVRSSVNRSLNAETANLRRTARAGVAQLAAAEALERDTARWQRLPAALRDAASLRRRFPQDSLASLAARAHVSRSAMAGRLHRLTSLASMTYVADDRGEAGARLESSSRRARRAQPEWR